MKKIHSRFLNISQSPPALSTFYDSHLLPAQNEREIKHCLIPRKLDVKRDIRTEISKVTTDHTLAPIAQLLVPWNDK